MDTDGSGSIRSVILKVTGVSWIFAWVLCTFIAFRYRIANIILEEEAAIFPHILQTEARNKPDGNQQSEQPI